MYFMDTSLLILSFVRSAFFVELAFQNLTSGKMIADLFNLHKLVICLNKLLSTGNQDMLCIGNLQNQFWSFLDSR